MALPLMTIERDAIMPPTELSCCYIGATLLCSTITARTIQVNLDSSKFAVLPDFSIERLAAARSDWERHYQHLLAHEKEIRNVYASRKVYGKVGGASGYKFGVSRTMREMIAWTWDADEIGAFATSLDRLIATLPQSRKSGRGETKRLVELLTILWKHRLLAFPAGAVWKDDYIPSSAVADFDERFYGRFAEAIRRPSISRRASRSSRIIFTVCGGIEEVGDIDSALLQALQPFAPQPPKDALSSLCDHIHAMQVQAYGDNQSIMARIPESYRPAFIHRESELTRALASVDDLTHCHFHVTPMCSAITGRHILVNDHRSKFAILPGFAPERLAAARADWERHRNTSGVAPCRTQTTLHNINLCLRAGNVECFAGAVDTIVTTMLSGVAQYRGGPRESDGILRSGDPSRFVEVLTLLWKHNLLAFPAGDIWANKIVKMGTPAEIDELFYGGLTNAIRMMQNSSRWHTKSPHRCTFMIFLSCGGIQEIGDIDYAVLQLFKPFAPDRRSNPAIILCDQLRAVQLCTYDGHETPLGHIPHSYRPALTNQRPSRRSDPKFAWAAAAGSQVEVWILRLATYITALPVRVSLQGDISAFNLLLDYVIATPGLPIAPLNYCWRGFSPERSFAQYLESEMAQATDTTAQILAKVSRFFAWVLETEATDEDGVLAREYRNPLPPDHLPTHGANRGQTHRHAIPLQFIRMMREIIEQDDFAWPRTLEGDYMEWYNPETALLEHIWVPVRANTFSLRLRLPLRELQVRLLDSGEGDELVYRPEAGGWIANTGKWTPAQGARHKPRGFVRRILDYDLGKTLNGLYITTNKTQDHNTLFVDTGYEIPWENPEIIDIFCRLRDWQERYNPSLTPLSRADVRDPRLLASRDVASRLDKLHFLFRDPTNHAAPMEPVTQGRLRTFWLQLMHELERRLEANGITNDDGSKIELVTSRDDYGAPQGTSFDPHSLRVTGLTALATAGVPIRILSEFVAGHATILMTLYYQRPGAGEVTRVLDDAVAHLLDPATEASDFAARIKEQPLELLHELAAYNDEEGLRAAKDTQSALYALLDDGFCPNGGTMCWTGGPVIEKRHTVHGPVPGGPRNCPLCRFFVTGPAFLGGLVARFNETGGQMREHLRYLQELQARRREIIKDQLRTEANGDHVKDRRKLVRAEEDLAKAEGRIEVLWKTWVSLLQLIRRVEQIIANRKPEQTAPMATKNVLVLNGQVGDLVVSLEECTEYDLWSRICASSEFYTGVDARTPALRLTRLFDAMFAREGHPAIFAALSDEQLVTVGNAVARFLHSTVGDANANALVAGRMTLQELGIEEEIARVINRESGQPVSLTLAGPGKVALTGPELSVGTNGVA